MSPPDFLGNPERVALRNTKGRARLWRIAPYKKRFFTMLKKGDIVEVSVTDLAYGGKGVGKLDGLVVLVKGGLPGDTLKVIIEKKKRNFAEAKVVEVLKSSEKRIAPVCSYFGLCGGCTWQNLDYEAQLYYKEKTVRESLAHLGGFSDFETEKIVRSDDTYFYRNKMEFSFGKDFEGKLILGLHPLEDFRKVFDLEKCYLQSEAFKPDSLVGKGFLRKRGAYSLRP